MPTADVRTQAIRRVFEDDRTRLRSHMTRLGSDGLRARFGYHVSDRFLDAYAERCVSANAVVYGYFEDGMMHGVGEMHLAASGSELKGELAFSIESRWRRRGIGTRLIRHLLRAARDRQVERLMLQCSTENAAMLVLARRYATDVTFEQGLVTAHMQACGPSLCSRFCEGADDHRCRAARTAASAPNVLEPTDTAGLASAVFPVDQRVGRGVSLRS